jgi:hypothetical protein
MLAATEAFIQLKSYKKKEGFWEEKYRNKDIAIAWYEKYVTKCETQDSLNTIYRNNDALIIKDLSLDLKKVNYELEKQKLNSKIARGASIGLAISLPLGILAGIIAGIFIAK